MPTFTYKPNRYDSTINLEFEYTPPLYHDNLLLTNPIPWPGLNERSIDLNNYDHISEASLPLSAFPVASANPQSLQQYPLPDHLPDLLMPSPPIHVPSFNFLGECDIWSLWENTSEGRYSLLWYLDIARAMAAGNIYPNLNSDNSIPKGPHNQVLGLETKSALTMGSVLPSNTKKVNIRRAQEYTMRLHEIQCRGRDGSDTKDVISEESISVTKISKPRHRCNWHGCASEKVYKRKEHLRRHVNT